MKVYTVEQLQTLIDGMEAMAPRKLQEIVICFPYEDMVNIKTYDDQLLRKYAEFLTKLANTPYFVENFSNVRNTLCFLWNKLCDVNDLDAAEVITDLLLLYYTILKKVNGDIRILEFIVGSEGTLQAVFCVLQCRLLNVDHCTILTNILYLLISTDQKLMNDSVPILKIMFHQLKATSYVEELATICTLVVREYYMIDNLFSVCGNWLLSKGPELLRENISEITAENLLEGIAIIIVSTNLAYPEDFWKKMQRILSRLLHFLVSTNLRENSMLLISIIVSNYLGTEHSGVLELLNRLPWDVRCWPNDPHLKIFFIICELLYQNDEQFWFPQSILNAIFTFICSFYRFSLESVVLKSLCYLYPLLKPPIASKNYTIIGDSLLILVTRNASPCIEKIFSLHKDQLSWILSSGDMRLRKNVICYWLKFGNVDELAEVLKNSPSVKLLKPLIFDPYLDQEVSKRLEELISKCLDTKFLKNLILYIPVKYKDGVILSRLLRIGCKIPDNPVLMFKLCQFLLRMLLFLEEDNMKLLLVYIAQILVNLKANDNFDEFYNLTGIWKFLVFVNTKDSSVSTEIISLFKIMTMIQKSKKLSLNHSIEINLANSLRGSDDQAEKSLQLLQHILYSDGTFVKVHDKTMSRVFNTLFDLCSKPDYMTKSLKCLTMIMKKKPQFSVRKTTALFIEYHTSQNIAEELCPSMVVFLKCWLRSIKYVHKYTLKQQVNLLIVKNFLERISNMAIFKRHDIKLFVEEAIKWLINTCKE